MADVRLRFFFGKGNSFGRTTKRKLNETAVAIFRAVEIEYTEKLYQSIVNKWAKRIEKDIGFEIAHIARLYRNLIIDAPKSGNGAVTPARLYPAASGFPGGSIALNIPRGGWSPRDPDYINRKKREGYSQGWWKRTGFMGAVLGTKKGWQGIFGDKVSVNVKRTKSVAISETVRKATVNIEVTALEKLRLGDLRSTMIASAYDYSPMLGGRLNQTAYQTGKYRVTVEPFIDFVITKSFPHAIKRRLETGLVGATRNVSVDQPRLRR